MLFMLDFFFAATAAVWAWNELRWFEMCTKCINFEWERKKKSSMKCIAMANKFSGILLRCFRSIYSFTLCEHCIALHWHKECNSFNLQTVQYECNDTNKWREREKKNEAKETGNKKRLYLTFWTQLFIGYHDLRIRFSLSYKRIDSIHCIIKFNWVESCAFLNSLAASNQIICLRIIMKRIKFISQLKRKWINDLSTPHASKNIHILARDSRFGMCFCARVRPLYSDDWS